MKQISRWPVPVASLGSAVILAAALLHYLQAHRLGVPGGYVVTFLGAAATGAIAGACGYFATPSGSRSGVVAALIGAAVASVWLGILIVTLVSGFGT